MMVSAVEGYRLWAATYDTGVNPLISLEERTLLQRLPEGRPSRILDLACGTGRWTRRLRDRADNIVGIDCSPEMLNKAMHREGLRGRLLCADLESLPIADEHADWVVCALSLSYVQHLPNAFREMTRVCRNGAYLLISDLHPAAMRAGWSRSFRHGQGRYEVEHYGRDLNEIAEAAQAAGLQRLSLGAFTMGSPERELFRLAGKIEAFESWRAIPVLWIGIWRKLCG